MIKILRNMSLMWRLVLFVLAVALVPIGVVGYLTFSSAKTALEKSVLDGLDADRRLVRQNIIEYLEASVNDLILLANTHSVMSAFDQFSFYEKAGGASLEINSEEYTATTELIRPWFKKVLALCGVDKAYEDLLIIVGGPHGRVVYTQMGQDDLGANLETGALKDSLLATLWKKVAETRKPYVVDFSLYAPSGKAAAFIGVPVIVDERFCGALVLRIGPEKINAMMEAMAKKGKTGDAFILGKDLLMRSNARLSDSTMLRQKVDTRAAREALQGKKGIGIVTDYRGKSVLESWSKVGLSGIAAFGADFDWGVLAKIDAREAFEPITDLAYRVILIALGTGILVTFAGFFVARAIARPIVSIAGAVAKISQGDLTVHPPELERGDELGNLSRVFGTMVANLRQQINQVMEGVNVLGSNASEISATASQLAVSTSTTNSLVNESSTTVEELKQTGKVASEKAKSVAETAQKALDTSNSGRLATEQTVERMNIIKKQMESIGDTVERLSENSQAIEEIITSVQDLADQSNLLAVNASIEAARAGEQGKGFAVVATEIKTLADQSKEATERVRSILGEIGKWTSAVITAMEKGNQAVDAGLEQAIVAGESIRSLEHSVAESSQAATVIGASSEQQFVGITQVAAAMANIEQATEQNSAGSSQLQGAAEKLEALGGHLRDIVNRYRV